MMKNADFQDCKELRKLLLENPDLPLITMVGEDAYCGWDYSYYVADARAEIDELALYNNECYVDRERYEEYLRDDLADDIEYINLTDEEFDKMIENKMNGVEFIKAIVLWVG